LRYTVILCALVLICGLGLYFFVASGLSGPLPDQAYLRQIRQPVASSIFAADGSLLGKVYEENRSIVRLGNCPLFLTDALTAVEDVRFFQHKGIDFRSLGRVVFKGLLVSSSAGGGSTLTQQLAKNLFPRKGYFILTTPVNKLREMLIARRMERVYSKEQILELYLNTVSFGELAFGIATASERFFNKPPAALNPEEIAVLVGMLKAPTYYSPRRSPERALARRNTVFAQMLKYGKIDQPRFDSLSRLPLEIAYTPDKRPSELSGYIVSYIEWQAQHILDELGMTSSGRVPDVRTDGLKVYSTIDPSIQRYAETAILAQMPDIQSALIADWPGGRGDWVTPEWLNDEIRRLPACQRLIEDGATPAEAIQALNVETDMTVFSWKGSSETLAMTVSDSIAYYKRLLQTGLLAMDPNSGFIKAWVGGIDYHRFPYDHILSRRQVGSTFKPILYAAALEAGTSTCHYYDNAQVVFTAYDDWSPRNADRHYTGSYSLMGGLVYSVNTVAARILQETGIQTTIAMAKRLGISSEVPAVPSIALGSAEISLRELTTAYCVFANGGYFRAPVCIVRIEDQGGSVLYTYEEPLENKPVLADTVIQDLMCALQMVVDSGTASSLRTRFGLKLPLAGKTGTTQHYADGWFVGISPGLVAGIWVGADDPRVHFRSGAGAGGRTALPIYGAFIHEIENDPAYRWGRESPEFMGDLSSAPDCPLYSELSAIEAASAHQASGQDSWTLSEFLGSLFGNRGKDPAEIEQKLRRQMQTKLDRTVIRMQKRKKSPVEISRALEQIREDFRRRIAETRSAENAQ